MNYFLVLLATGWGLILGSFLNVVVWRWPREENLGGRSKCSNCGIQVQAKHLVPVLSFILLKGRCAGCAKKISWRYPIIEIVSGVLWGLVALVGLHSHHSLVWVVFTGVFLSWLLVLTVIDLEHQIIPDRLLVWGGVWVLLAYGVLIIFDPNFGLMLTLGSRLVSSLILGFGLHVIWWLSRGRLFGLGDVKFLAILGLLFGYYAFLILLLAVWGGGLIGSILLVSRRAKLNDVIPFGPFLALSAVVVWFWGEMIWHWYISFLL